MEQVYNRSKQEKVQAEKDKKFVYGVTDKIRAGLNRAGISEERF